MIRASIGVMTGAEAGAVVDTDRLYELELSGVTRMNLRLLVGLGTCPRLRLGLSIVRPIERAMMTLRRTT